MFFAFRYAGGLAQYWVILVAYPICKATERLPRGRKGFFLNPGPPFSPKEHTLVMTMAIAGSLAGTLGLSGGMLALSLDFGVRFNTAQIYIWALMAGFFGIFFGTLFGVVICCGFTAPLVYAVCCWPGEDAKKLEEDNQSRHARVAEEARLAEEARVAAEAMRWQAPRSARAAA